MTTARANPMRRRRRPVSGQWTVRLDDLADDAGRDREGITAAIDYALTATGFTVVSVAYPLELNAAPCGTDLPKRHRKRRESGGTR